ncbi:transposable element Tcb1 transposase [Trichonephila clavipes]|nr:transposable element Tcb1 transposase [Trichonephila clavipes]
MAQRKHLDDFLSGRIIGRLECGRTQLEVSEELGIVQSVISRLWQRFQDDVTAKRNRRSTTPDLSRQLSSATGTTVSRQTVYRRLGHIGLYARRPVRCVPLTATHCRLRLTWSRVHALWTPQQWSCVMFSDESRFSLQFDSHRTLTLRAPGTRYHQENTIERHRYGVAAWLVWGGIIIGSRTDLHVQSVTMTGHIYRDVILEQHVRWFRGAMGAEFLFMDDNARPHRANIVDKCLQSEPITRMDWPAYSPKLNPIEHVWDMLDRRIAARQPPPTCLPELRRALLDEWCNIPQDQIDNFILSMPRRCRMDEEIVLLAARYYRKWAAEHRHWIQSDWSQVLFTEESGFSLEWTPDVFCEILRPHVVPYAAAISDFLLLMQDNARNHTARLVRNCLEAKTIQHMEWPACSLDLNLIEHAWDLFGRRIQRDHCPRLLSRDCTP